MTLSEKLTQAILERLRTVIDPETGVDVVTMQLIEALHVDDQGHVSYRFRPSSFVCPLAVTLALSIQSAVGEVEGICEQNLQVVGYAQSELLTELLKMEREQQHAALARADTQSVKATAGGMS